MSIKRIFWSLLPPLASLFILCLANASNVTLIMLKLSTYGATPMMISLHVSIYYLGMIYNAIIVGPMLARFGPVKLYALLTTLCGLVYFVHGIYLTPWLWLPLRFIAGFCIGGIFIVIEGWIVNAASNINRARVLSLYMISSYAATSLGQLLINCGSFENLELFLLSTCLAVLSILPICSSRSNPPAFPSKPSLKLRNILKLCPSYLIGCFLGGALLACVYGIMPNYAKAHDMTTFQISIFMTSLIMGGMLLQFPMGKLSDLVSRQLAIIYACLGLIAVSVAIILLPHTWFVGMAILAFLLGGFAYCIYPLNVSAICDKVDKKELIPALQALFIAYASGAIFGPIFSALLSRYFITDAVMVLFMIIGLIMISFSVFQMKKNRPDSKTQPIHP